MAAKEQLAAALADVIAMSVDSRWLSVSPRGPGSPAMDKRRAEASAAPPGAEAAKRRGVSAAGAAAPVAAPDGGEEPAAPWPPAPAEGAGCGEDAAATPPPGAAAARRFRARRPLVLDLAGLDGGAAEPPAAGLSTLSSASCAATEWIDRMEAELSSRSRRTSAGVGGGEAEPRAGNVPPAFVCLGVISGGDSACP
ncbi:hypothetical protein Rsub_03789 [Raphidocelis subcapitata]|uniref:Uncharacterized protein n=1 Tax=Raphidocelis subcapitata TaxID=307507 RepID=A0A2V0NTH2_9CHLO|nr:hypothetical protein Rsub_03789 [Raphidocelis subcapitata]|eukprot:GBF90934.1 hypothetical protein Rsub_03789 [Raphidocelis subcapitata]